MKRLILLSLWCAALMVSTMTASPRRLSAKINPMTDDEVVVRTDEAHRLLLPKDWPVQHQDGVVAPAPIEQYLSMKFGQVKESFAQTDQRLDALERRITQLEQDNKMLQKRLRLLEEQVQEQEVNDGTTTKKP